MLAYASPYLRLRRRAHHGVQGAQVGSDFRLGGRARTGPELSLRVGGENAAASLSRFCAWPGRRPVAVHSGPGQMVVKKVVRFLTPPLARQPHESSCFSITQEAL